VATTDRIGQDQVLAIDVGATYIKFAHVTTSGTVLDEATRTRTPYPCWPNQLVQTLSNLIVESPCHSIAVGFPGEFVNGVVIEPGNLSRVGGISTAVDPLIEQQWRRFNLQMALCESTHRDVRVVNDATLAALGCSRGVGREFVVTLGTGFGIALVVDGVVERIRDVGAEVYVDDRTYDELLGEPSRRDNEQEWNAFLRSAVQSFVCEFRADTVHLGGGNARRVTPDLFMGESFTVVLHDNEAPLRGAAKLFGH
jgi:polyphosphate glucokinase